MKRLFLALGLVVLAAVTAACSSSAAQPPASAGPVDPNAPVIVAQGNAFSPATLDVTADKAFSLTLDNKDSAPHNVAIYTDSSAVDVDLGRRDRQLHQGDPAGAGARRRLVLLPVRRPPRDDGHDQREVARSPSSPTTAPWHNATGPFRFLGR